MPIRAALRGGADRLTIFSTPPRLGVDQTYRRESARAL